MTPLNTVKFNELNKFLIDNCCFGFTAAKRKHTIIYTFKRFFVSKTKLLIKVKVMAKTKYIMSVKIEDVIYTDYDELKKKIQ